MRSLEILLEAGGLECGEAEKTMLAGQKNAWYVEYIRDMDESELLPGARECLLRLRQKGVRIALASASKNAPTVISRLNIADLRPRMGGPPLIPTFGTDSRALPTNSGTIGVTFADHSRPGTLR